MVDGIGRAPDMNALRRLLHDLFVETEPVPWPETAPTFEPAGSARDAAVLEHGEATYALIPYPRWTTLDGDLEPTKPLLRFDEQPLPKGLPA